MANEPNEKRRPVLGGAMFGGAIALLLVALNVGPTQFLIPWGVAGAVIGGGFLGNTIRDAAGDVSIQSMLETFFSRIGDLFAPLFEFVGDVFGDTSP